MMKHKLFALAIIAFLSLPVFAQEPEVMKIANQELQRNMNELSKQELPPYFISYTITDKKDISLSASNGKMKKASITEGRIFDMDLRVGDYDFDNTHIIRGSNSDFSFFSSLNYLPMNADAEAIRSKIWIATDRKYKSAIERYEKALSNKAVKVAEEDSSADFSIEDPEVFFGKKSQLILDTVTWNARLRRLSERFNAYPLIFSSGLSLNGEWRHTMLVNTEGTKVSSYHQGVRVMISAKTKADDGMSLPVFYDWFAFNPDELPTEDVMAAKVDELIKLLMDLRQAPLATTYSGPCMLSGEASGVFFHEIFGHRVEGHREKDPSSAQTFKNSIGESILPDFVDVIFDPSIKQLVGQDLHGYYQFDDEGVRGQKVITVDDGIFKGFLMSRCPIEGFSKSNGHGRKAAGRNCVTRQSNLIVEASKTIPMDAVRDTLRAEAKRQGKEYGLYFVNVSGGYTFTSRSIPNSFNVTPLVVYKIYVDGRPDELVRGVDLIGTPLSTFANVFGAGDDYGVFNGICGAESGPVPVSASSPTLLVKKIEVQKKAKSQAKLPLLPAPTMKHNP
jgi:predicted Zn-dependent protease